MRPMWKTSEFWTGIVGNVVGVLVLTGAFSSAAASEITAAVGQIAAGVGTILTAITLIIAQLRRKAIVAGLREAALSNTSGNATATACSLHALTKDI